MIETSAGLRHWPAEVLAFQSRFYRLLRNRFHGHAESPGDPATERGGDDAKAAGLRRREADASITIAAAVIVASHFDPLSVFEPQVRVHRSALHVNLVRLPRDHVDHKHLAEGTRPVG